MKEVNCSVRINGNSPALPMAPLDVSARGRHERHLVLLMEVLWRFLPLYSRMLEF